MLRSICGSGTANVNEFFFLLIAMEVHEVNYESNADD
jgi:hypothetical protein